MSRALIRMIASFAGVLVTLGAAGCAAPTTVASGQASPSAEPSGQHLPVRPEILALTGVNPCDLLTANQRDDLNLSNGSVDDSLSDGNLQGSMCLWSGLARHPDNGYTGSVVINKGAADTTSTEPIRTVDGFAAVPSTSPAAEPQWFCQLFVDVAPGQTLMAAYDNGAHDYPGMNHQVACDKAQLLAEDMIGNLRAKLGK